MGELGEPEKTRERLSKSTALSSDQQRRLFEILGEEIDFVDNPTFHDPRAFTSLFEDRPAVAVPDLAWYHDMMSGPGPATGQDPGEVTPLANEVERSLFLQFHGACHKLAVLKRQAEPLSTIPDKLAHELLAWDEVRRDRCDLIAKCFLKWVLILVCKRIWATTISREDAVGECNKALAVAIKKYDVEQLSRSGQPTRFTAYASVVLNNCINGLLRKYYEEKGRARPLPVDRNGQPIDVPDTTTNVLHDLSEWDEEFLVEMRWGKGDEKGIVPAEAMGVDNKLAYSLGRYRIWITAAEGKSPRGGEAAEHREIRSDEIDRTQVMPRELRFCWARRKAWAVCLSRLCTKRLGASM